MLYLDVNDIDYSSLANAIAAVPDPMTEDVTIRHYTVGGSRIMSTPSISIPANSQVNAYRLRIVGMVGSVKSGGQILLDGTTGQANVINASAYNDYGLTIDNLEIDGKDGAYGIFINTVPTYVLLKNLNIKCTTQSCLYTRSTSEPRIINCVMEATADEAVYSTRAFQAINSIFKGTTYGLNITVGGRFINCVIIGTVGSAIYRLENSIFKNTVFYGSSRIASIYTPAGITKYSTVFDNCLLYSPTGLMSIGNTIADFISSFGDFTLVNVIESDPLFTGTGDALEYATPTTSSPLLASNIGMIENPLYATDNNPLSIGVYDDYTEVSADDIIDTAGGNFVVSTLTNAKILATTLWGLIGVGSRTDAPVANVTDGTLYGPDGTGLEGELVIDYPERENVLNTDTVDGLPGLWQKATAAYYKLSETFGVNGTSENGLYDNSTNPDYVIASQSGNWVDTNLEPATVKDGEAFGLGEEGTYGFDYPSINDVRLDTVFDSGNLTGNLRLPAISDVRDETVFDTLDSLEGNVILPKPSDVRRDVPYDSEGSVLGTYDNLSTLPVLPDPTGQSGGSSAVKASLPGGMAYSAVTPEDDAGPVNPTLEISPESLYINLGDTAYISYASYNAVRVTVDGIDSELAGMVERTPGALGSYQVGITAYGEFGTTPATGTANIIVSAEGSTPPEWSSSRLAVDCGSSRNCEPGTVYVPYWTSGAESLNVTLYKDDVEVASDAAPIAEYGTLFYKFTAEGVSEYHLEFQALSSVGSASDSCTLTCDGSTLVEPSIKITVPAEMDFFRPDTDFEVSAYVTFPEGAVVSDVTINQSGGSGNLNFEYGSEYAINEHGLANAERVSYTLAVSDDSDTAQVTATVTIDGVEYSDTVAIGFIADALVVTITPVAYNALIAASKQNWTLDAVVTARDLNDDVITTFQKPVNLLGQLVPKTNWIGRTDIDGMVTSYVPGDVWVDEAEVIDIGLTQLPAEAFHNGSCVVRVLMDTPLYGVDKYAPYDENSSWAEFNLTASPTYGAQFAPVIGYAELLGQDWLTVDLPSALEDDTDTLLEPSMFDSKGNPVPTSKYASAEMTVTAIDDNGVEVQVSLDGIIYGSSIQAPYGELHLYYDLDTAASPISTSVVVTGLAYEPYGSATRDTFAPSLSTVFQVISTPNSSPVSHDETWPIINAKSVGLIEVISYRRTTLGLFGGPDYYISRNCVIAAGVKGASLLTVNYSLRNDLGTDQDFKVISFTDLPVTGADMLAGTVHGTLVATAGLNSGLEPGSIVDQQDYDISSILDGTTDTFYIMIVHEADLAGTGFPTVPSGDRVESIVFSANAEV